MIVYNVDRKFFPMKNDADDHRKALKLPGSALHTLRIETREELAALLNGLFATGPAAPLEPVAEPDLDFIPKFVRDDWARRRQLQKARDQ